MLQAILIGLLGWETPWSLLDVTAQALEDQDEPPDNHIMFSSGTLLYSGKT